MENNLMVFNSEDFGEIRTIEENGEQLFCGSDIAKALGYIRPNDAINQHCRATVKRSIPISGKRQSVNFIHEGDLYRLIVHSKLPSAEKFERWVFDEVLPQLRKTGQYKINSVNSDIRKSEAEAKLNNSKARLANIYLKLLDVQTKSETYKNIIICKAAEALAGEPILPLPKVEKKTYSAKEIGDIIGVSSNKIGRIANSNNLKASEYGEWYRDKSKSSNKEVDTFRYYDNAIDEIKNILGGY